MTITARRQDLSFWTRCVAAALLVSLADLLFYGHSPGSSLGIFGLAWTGAVAATHPEARRHGCGLLATAAGFALLQIEAPSFVGWTLFWTALAAAALTARSGDGEDVWRRAQRLCVLATAGLVAPVLDLHQVIVRTRRKGRPALLRPVLEPLILPAAGGSVFLALFAAANPVIANLLASLNTPEIDIWRGLFWAATLVAVWSVLRPRFLRRPLPTPLCDGDGPLPWVSTPSVTLSLILFNGLLALQNGLDVAFLWSGGGLPDGLSFADYAHRGAYPLIGTALLSGLFVLVALRPGSATSRRPLIRRLVVLWTVQNVFLVASSMLRTLDYIGAYSLTRLRIAALVWMGLVGVGLALILWRMLRGKSSGWLLNANAVAAGVVLAAASVVDLGSVAATWNVRHARELGWPGADLDVPYLRQLGDSAVVPMAELQLGALPPALRARVAQAETEALGDLKARQSDWRSWSWRGARRLERTEAILSARPIEAQPLTSTGRP